MDADAKLGRSLPNDLGKMTGNFGEGGFAKIVLFDFIIPRGCCPLDGLDFCWHAFAPFGPEQILSSAVLQGATVVNGLLYCVVFGATECIRVQL